LRLSSTEANSSAGAEALRRRRDLRHPAADEIARRQRLLLVREGADAAAVGVAEHDDVLHPERLDAELERGARAVLRSPSRIVGRHDVGNVAHHQQLAWGRVEDDLRRDA
jgi:hypothetical protein